VKDILIRLFTTFNAWLLRITKGGLGGKMGSQTILLLRTMGRKTKQVREIPIAYFEYGNAYLIVASNWGKDVQAGWYFNLKENPAAQLEIHGKVIDVLAREAEGDEYEKLWGFVSQRHPPYLDYQKMTTRHIPILVFEPKM
jgi:deazaflavin-dependent oxidoreductase (nitroreductase family)